MADSLFKRFKADSDGVLIAFNPSVAIGDDINEIDIFVLILIKRKQPFNHLFSGIPNAICNKIE